jgi:1-acyl-sn-glycerol-3-phosphate acyltransferase
MPANTFGTRERMMNILRSVAGVVANIEVVGSEHVPDQGAYILTTSHISRLDTPLLMLSTSRKDIIGMVATDYRRSPFGGILKKLGVIWINREGYDFEAFRDASAFLKKGGIVGLAPEGKRSKDGGLMEGKPGAVLLAMKNKVSIIPAAVLGSADMVKCFLKLKKMQVKIIFGQPFDLPQAAEGQNEKEILELGVTEMMCQIAALLPEERRGYYQNHPRLKVLLAAQQNLK